MKLFKLELDVEYQVDYSNLAFIIIAHDEEEARKFASETNGYEISSRGNPWLQAECSTCKEIDINSHQSGIILNNFHYYDCD